MQRFGMWMQNQLKLKHFQYIRYLLPISRLFIQYHINEKQNKTEESVICECGAVLSSGVRNATTTTTTTTES